MSKKPDDEVKRLSDVGVPDEVLGRAREQRRRRPEEQRERRPTRMKAHFVSSGDSPDA